MARRDYSAEEIDLGMTYLVMAAGNHREAARCLEAERGLSVPPTTLRDWRLKTHREAYADIKTRLEQKRREELAEDAISLVQKEMRAAHLAVDQVISDLEAGNIAAKDAPKALRDLNLSFGIAIDKSNVLLDRPTEIVERRIDMTALDAALDALLLRSPDAITDAEVVESPALSAGGSE